MSKYIKLSNCIINKAYIIEIIKQQNLYLIYLFQSNDAFNKFRSIPDYNKKDFDKITKFIKKIK